MPDAVIIRLDTADLDAIKANLGYNTDQMLAMLAADVTAMAKAFAPVDTGALRASIEYKKISGKLYEVADGVNYGIYQEYGTSRMRSQPFMTPAVEATGNRVKEYTGGLIKA